MLPVPGIAAAKQRQQLLIRQAEGEGDGVLPVGGKDDVPIPQGAGGANLRRLLPQHGRPQTEFAVSLQCRRLGVKTPCQHHVPQTADEVTDGSIEGMLGMIDAPSVGRQQLHHVAFHQLPFQLPTQP